MARGKVRTHIVGFWRLFFGDHDVDPTTVREINPLASNISQNYFYVANVKLSRITRDDGLMPGKLINADGSKYEGATFRVKEDRKRIQSGHSTRSIRFSKEQDKSIAGFPLDAWVKMQHVEDGDLLIFALSKPVHGQQHVLLRPVRKILFALEAVLSSVRFRFF